MNPFRTEREAKEFLVGKIVSEAQRDGVPLSEIERKMLYFAETAQPEMREVAAAFERECDEDAYEEKIATLVRSIYAREDRSEQEIETWNDAVVRLSAEDHYLLLLIDGASASLTQFPSSLGRLGKWVPTFDGSGKREPGDRMRLILVGLGFAAVLITAMILTFIFH